MRYKLHSGPEKVQNLLVMFNFEDETWILISKSLLKVFASRHFTSVRRTLICLHQLAKVLSQDLLESVLVLASLRKLLSLPLISLWHIFLHLTIYQTRTLIEEPMLLWVASLFCNIPRTLKMVIDGYTAILSCVGVVGCWLLLRAWAVDITSGNAVNRHRDMGWFSVWLLVLLVQRSPHCALNLSFFNRFGPDNAHDLLQLLYLLQTTHLTVLLGNELRHF